MKKIAILLLGILLTSCNNQFYQIIDVGTMTCEKEANNYVWSDGQCKVTYDFWSPNGAVAFVVENLTDQMLYINKGESFYTSNGYAYDYFQNRTYNQSSLVSHTAGLAAKATAYGTWSASKLPGKLSTAVSSINSYGSSLGVSYEEKEIVGIPPHSFKTFSEFIILDDVIQECDIKLFPARHKPEAKSYGSKDTPLHFSNVLTYKVGDKGEKKQVEHKFYIDQFTNYVKKDVLEKSTSGCKNTVQIELNKYQSGSRFYIIYNKNHANAFSEDSSTPYPNSK